MSAEGKAKHQKKNEYFEKLVGLLEEYPKIMIINCDNIGSHHMQIVRIKLRGRAIILMGKNTMIRRAIRQNISRNPAWENILPHIYGNVGLVFTHEDLSEIREQVQATRVPASAKNGTFAPKDVHIPKGMTTLEPTKTSFLQALNIPSKINKGNIEILNDVHLIKKGERIGSSEAVLLQMLDVKPFEYSLQVIQIYDGGVIYSADILNLTDEDILGRFGEGVANVAALSLGLHYATVAAYPHVLLNAFKNCVSITLATEFMFDQAQKLKHIVENPNAFAASSGPAPAAKAGGGAAPAPVVEEVKEESEEAAFDLFG